MVVVLVCALEQDSVSQPFDGHETPDNKMVEHLVICEEIISIKCGEFELHKGAPNKCKGAIVVPGAVIGNH